MTRRNATASRNVKHSGDWACQQCVNALFECEREGKKRTHLLSGRTPLFGSWGDGDDQWYDGSRLTGRQMVLSHANMSHLNYTWPNVSKKWVITFYPQIYLISFVIRHDFFFYTSYYLNYYVFPTLWEYFMTIREAQDLISSEIQVQIHITTYA